MIDKPTVFILGAGASVPYGYPPGEGLRENICNKYADRYRNLLVKSHPDISETDLKYFMKSVMQFTETFCNSSTSSIDLFLSRNIKIADIGKEAIVISIMDAEGRSHFRERMAPSLRTQDWYSYLFQKLTEDMIGPESYNKFNQNKVTFITFNYDRSLEYYLYESLKNSFSSAPVQKINDQFSKIQIFHVYGVVDKLPWQEGWLTKYGEEPSFSTIAKMKKNIRIVHEKTLEVDVSLIRQSIKEASRIFFLGFGYAQENLDILSLSSILNTRQQIYGTAFNLTAKEISGIRARLRKDNDHPPDHQTIINTDCRMLLREWL